MYGLYTLPEINTIFFNGGRLAGLPSMIPFVYLEDLGYNRYAGDCINSAIIYEKKGNWSAAVAKYKEAEKYLELRVVSKPQNADQIAIWRYHYEAKERAKLLSEYIKELEADAKKKTDEVTAIAERATDEEVTATAERTADEDDDNVCNICLDAKKNYIFLPCAHMCTCEKCGSNPSISQCPICRGNIKQRLKVFL